MCSNLNKNEEFSERMFNRNIPSSNIDIQFSMRPISTKYTLMPIIDQYKQSNVPIIISTTYNVGKVFNPGNDMGPWNGFSNNVDIETLLRNQIFSLQNCEQSVYVPSSTSDLYNSDNIETNQMQPYPKLFEPAMFDNFNPNHYIISSDKIDESLLNGIEAILAPISDDGYKYNHFIYDSDKVYNDKKRLEISIYVEGEDTFTEKSNIIIGSEIKEAVLTLLDFLKRRTGNEASIYVCDHNDYQFIDMKDTDIHGLEDLDDLREEYAETDSMKIVVLL